MLGIGSGIRRGRETGLDQRQGAQGTGRGGKGISSEWSRSAWSVSLSEGWEVCALRCRLGDQLEGCRSRMVAVLDRPTESHAEWPGESSSGG